MGGLAENLTNPALLFFLLGILSVRFKNDLKIPDSSSKFISTYLLICIGFRGGYELAHSSFNSEIISSLAFGLVLAASVPLISFYILKRKVNIYDAGAIASAYGSVSAVTFITAVSYLSYKGLSFDGHMIAVMALMEAPAIAVGIFLINMSQSKSRTSMKQVMNHALNNASVFLILGSLLIGALASDSQAQKIEPFTTEIFAGFLIVFLLDMGIRAGSQLGAMRQNGIFLLLFSSLFPFVIGTLTFFAASWITNNPGNIFLFSLLAASASYIAVPAAFKHAVPQANPGTYLPMALGITFPINVILGIPYYMWLIESMTPYIT